MYTDASTSPKEAILLIYINNFVIFQIEARYVFSVDFYMWKETFKLVKVFF